MISGINPIGIAALAVVAIGSFWAGSSLKQASWDRATNKALVLQQELNQQSEEERRILNEANLQLQLELEQAERNIGRMADEIQDAINRATVVTTYSPETPKDCPAVRCNIVDAARHYRLFNDAITNTLEEVSTSGSTRFGDARVPGAVPASGVDGPGRPYDRSRAF